ncbi:MAG: RraA family protein [Verrucomicrobiota bacterium JB024]|nr:RraA family protein [Verrucomicrobiota bacterium JB024]
MDSSLRQETLADPRPQENASRITHREMLQLKRWNTPTIYNGWEQITHADIAADAFNLEETCDFMPWMGPMVGRAVTVMIEPGNTAHTRNAAVAWREYREYLASVPGPKIVVVQDLEKPRTIGSFWGEVNSNAHRALGCVGTITDGAIRDLDEMANAGFKALARRLCVGHAHVTPVRWNVPVEVFGRTVRPGQLIHADKHGFMAVPEEDEPGLLDAVLFMDANECKTVIPAARESGRSFEAIIQDLAKAGQAFSQAAQDKFNRRGEW